jgi:hypothetical protein
MPFLPPLVRARPNAPIKDVMPLLISLLMPLVQDIKRDIVRTPEKEGQASGRTGSY